MSIRTITRRFVPTSCCLSAAVGTFEAAARSYVARLSSDDPRAQAIILNGHVYPPNVSRSNPTFRAAALAEGVTRTSTAGPAVNGGAQQGRVIAATAEFEYAARVFLANFSGVDEPTAYAIHHMHTGDYGFDHSKVHVTFLAASLAHVVNSLIQAQALQHCRRHLN
jgi:hypothetical protein